MIVGVLAAILVVAVLRAVKHFRGGGCCGSGSTTVRSRKKLTAPKLGEKVLTVQGMHCENCQNRIEHALNRLDGVVCKVNLRKQTAVVSFSTEVSNEVLKEMVEKLGFEVTDIQSR